MSSKCRFLNNLNSNHVVTMSADSKGVREPPVSVASIRLKAIRFDTDPWIALFLSNLADFWHLRGPFREGDSKRSSESARDITIELYSVSREMSGGERILKRVALENTAYRFGPNYSAALAARVSTTAMFWSNSSGMACRPCK